MLRQRTVLMFGVSETEPSETEPSETEPSETEPSETDFSIAAINQSFSRRLYPCQTHNVILHLE